MSNPSEKKTSSIQDAINNYLKIIFKPNFSRSRLMELSINSPINLKHSENSTRPQRKFEESLKSKASQNIQTMKILRRFDIRENYNLNNVKISSHQAVLSPKHLEPQPRLSLKFSPSNLASNFMFLGEKSGRVSKILTKNPKKLRISHLPLIKSHKRRSSSADVSTMTIKAWEVTTPKRY
jgi:hypothetical protein